MKKGNILLCAEEKERKGEINIGSVEEQTNKGKGGKYLKMENILLCFEEKINGEGKGGKYLEKGKFGLLRRRKTEKEQMGETNTW